MNSDMNSPSSANASARKNPQAKPMQSGDSALTEEKMALLIKMPDFLITMDAYNELKDPPLKNFKYQEIRYKL